MASTGKKLPGTGSNFDSGDTVWATPTDIEAEAGDSQFSAIGDFDQSDWLRGSNYTWGFPGPVTIDGMECEIGLYSENLGASATFVEVRIFNAVSIPVGDNNSADYSVPTFATQTESNLSFATDLWGLTPTQANLEDVDWGFGVRMMVNAGGDFALISWLKMNTFYTLSETLDVTGTIIGATEGQVEAGGRTIILTLGGGPNWLAAGTPFNDSRQGIIDGVTSGQIPAETLGWLNEIRNKIGVAQVVRTSNTVVTITLLAAETAGYKITSNDPLSATMASTLHTGSTSVTDLFFTTITAECDQTLAPDAIITQTNLTGAVTDIDESVDAPDANWLLVA